MKTSAYYSYLSTVTASRMCRHIKDLFYFDRLQEEQVLIVLYGDDISRCHKLFTPFKTYLVSGARVREPRSYLVRFNNFEWVVDKYTIVESITNREVGEAPLPPTTKLNTLSFSHL